MSGAKALSDYTTKVIVPLSETDEYYCLAWVVYVESPSGDGDDQAYLANYVTIDGDYLSSIPVSEPNGVDAISGQSTGFDFGAYDQQEKAFDITQSGTVKQVTVPVLVDKQSGKAAFLGGAKRQILCVDYTQFSENGELVSPFDEDGESFNSMDVAVYANFIRVYDYFASMGWQGPNNQEPRRSFRWTTGKTASPRTTACTWGGSAAGRPSLGRVHDYGSATDIVAHEFTHCLTGTTMTTNLYANEPGAINEGMSDIMGNLVEMALDGDAGAWVIGENAMEGGMRSMSDPNEHVQPERRWDVYYTLDAPEATVMNDNGGVHVTMGRLDQCVAKERGLRLNYRMACRER